LRDLFQEGASKIRLPRRPGDAIEAVAINTAGGLTGGDNLDWEFAAESGAALTITTQASEKVYRAASGVAETRVKLSAGPRARLCWLPQETILFDGSAVTREIDVDLATDAELILVEALVFGRGAMGETVGDCQFRDRWRVRVAGGLVHAEEFRLVGDPSRILATAATAAGGAAMASVLVIGRDSEAALAEVREHFSRAPNLAAGASHVTVGRTGKLLARMVAENGYALRKVLAPLIATLHGGEGLPKIWAT
jgi:urease accessory protein